MSGASQKSGLRRPAASRTNPTEKVETNERDHHGLPGRNGPQGPNRGTFEAKMTKAVRTRLADLGEFKLRTAQSHLYIQPLDEDIDMDEAFRRVSKVFGHCAAQPCRRLRKGLCRHLPDREDYLGKTLRGIRSFKVEAKRSDKTFPMKSPGTLPGAGGLSAVQAPPPAGGCAQPSAGGHGGDPGLWRLHPRPQGARPPAACRWAPAAAR